MKREDFFEKWFFSRERSLSRETKICIEKFSCPLKKNQRLDRNYTFCCSSSSSSTSLRSNFKVINIKRQMRHANEAGEKRSFFLSPQFMCVCKSRRFGHVLVEAILVTLQPESLFVNFLNKLLSCALGSMIFAVKCVNKSVKLASM